MLKLTRLKAKIQEKIFLNPGVRRVLNGAYRAVFQQEGRSARKYRNQYSTKLIVGFPLSHLYFMEHIRDLIDSLAGNEKIHPMLFSTTKSIPLTRHKKNEIFKFFSSRYGIDYNKNLFAYPWLKTSDIKLLFVLSLSTYGCELDCPKVMYTHGMAGLNFSKDLKHVRDLSEYDAVFLNGPLHKRALLTAQKTHGGRLPEMYEIGYLRGDRLMKLSGSFNRSGLLESLGLPDVPTAMYAPTWGEFSSTFEWIDKVIEVCNDMDINLLLRLHPFMLTEHTKWKTGGINWNEKLSGIAARHKQVRIVMNHDLDDIMLASDVMITDVSGMALEFLTISKPVVFLPAPKFFELYGTERPENWCRPEYEIKNRAGLREELKKALNGEGFLYPVDKLVYNKGKSLEVMVKGIEQVIRAGM